jgi:hypothetical protein
MKKRNILSTSKLKEIKKKKRKKIRNRIIIFSVIFLLILTGLIFLSRWQEMNIQDIQVVGNKIIDAQDIKKIAETKLVGNFIFVFPKKNSFLYPENKIKNKLSEEFKRLKEIEVEVDANDLQTLWITVSEYEGKYLWCGENIVQEDFEFNNQDCYFLDSEGYIFDKAPYFSGEVYFKFYGNSGFDSLSPISSHFFPESFKKIILLKEAIEKMNLKLSSFSLENQEDGNLFLSCNGKTQNAPRIIFKLNSDYNKLIENLQSAITTEPLQSDLKNRLNNLNYIDLRFGNKIFYKFRQNNDENGKPAETFNLE